MPSRWLLRLDAVLRAVGLDGAARPRAGDRRRRDEYRSADGRAGRYRRPRRARRSRHGRAGSRSPRSRPGCAIPTRSTPSTSCGCRALDPLDADPDRADLGIAIHQALAEFVRRFPRDLPAACRDRAAARSAARHFGAIAVAARRLGVLVAALRAHRALVRRRGSDRAAPASSRATSEVEGSLIVAAPGRPVHDHRAAPTASTAVDGRTFGDRLQDRLGAATRPRSRRLSRRSCRSKARSPRAGGFGGASRRPRRRSNIGSSAAAIRPASACPLGKDDPRR